MHISDINLKGFEARTKLKEIGRFLIYKPMYYRPDVYFHATKVFHLVKAALPRVIEVFGDTFDANKALTIALIHDDPEIITGDIQAGPRSKMSKAKLQELELNEKNAIEILASQSPQQINNYNYKSILLEITDKNTIESQVVKYLDHIDAFCEALHEIYAGNKAFITNVIDHQLGKIDTPYEYYINRFNVHAKYYPLITELINDTAPFFSTYDMPDIPAIISRAQPHSYESLLQNTNNSIYEWRKGVLINNLTPEELQNLYIPKEMI